MRAEWTSSSTDVRVDGTGCSRADSGMSSLSRSSRTMRSAVFLPTPGIDDNFRTSPLATASARSVGSMPDKIIRAAPQMLQPGTKLGPYEIVAPLGAGGMGEVYRARDTRLDRTVAVKILPADFAQNEQLRLRFEREAKAISSLNHPNICTLYDVGDNYLVMELLDGESLADRIARGPLPIEQTLRIGAEIAAALDRAHRSGIVHRDLKPGNVMLTKSGAKLLDFGLATSGIAAS